MQSGLASEILKSAVAVGTISDPSWAAALAPYRVAVTAFAESLKNESAFFRMVDAMVPMPLRTKVVKSSSTGNASIISEGRVKPITKLTLTSDQIDAVKAVGILAVSRELAKLQAEGSEKFIRTELRKSVVKAVDAQFLAILAAAGAITTNVSAGGDAAAVQTDLSNTFASLTTSAASRLFWIAGTTTAKHAAAMMKDGVFLFPDMGPTGGTMANIPAIVSDEITADSLMLVDAAQIGGALETIVFDVAEHTSLQFETAPDSPPTGATVPVSLWQHDLSALRAEVYFGAKPLRSIVAAQLTLVSWGSPNSPD
ncbi:MAG: phage major capsid protein [Parvibaculaceae bacterium]